MKSSLLTKAALCICPPAVVATTAATVPPVRRAVHHLTAPAHPARPVRQAPPCVPVASRTLASGLPAALVPEEPVAFAAIVPPTGTGGTPVGPAPLNPPALGGGPGVFPGGPGIIPGTPGTPGTPDTPAVPEPAAWITMVLGFGLIGAGLRQRHRYVLRSRATAYAGGSNASAPGRGLASLLGGGAISSAAMMAGGAAPVQATARIGQLGAKALNASMLAKTAMCVCPPVAMALGTAAIPPVRHAVYNATAPSRPTMLAPAVLSNRRPCVPVDVPTAAESVRQGGDTLAVFRPTPAWPS